MSKIPYTHRTWPTKPFTLITNTHYLRHTTTLPQGQAAIRVARLMALTHNTIFRAFNAIYTQAPALNPLSKRDTSDFATFALSAVDFLENHHKCEELVFFPMLEAQAHKPGLMDDNVEQHRDFDVPLRSLRDYLDDVQSGKVMLDAKALQGRIDTLAGPLQRHLNEEIPTILEAGGDMDDEAMTACYKALHDEAEGTTDPFRTFHGEPRETEFFAFGGGPVKWSVKNGDGFGWVLWVLFAVLIALAVYFGRVNQLDFDLDWKVLEEATVGNLSTFKKGYF
ncbi:hypothetical protein OQA88_2556 [Cercophora sp. LCS_1]